MGSLFQTFFLDLVPRTLKLMHSLACSHLKILILTFLSFFPLPVLWALSPGNVEYKVSEANMNCQVLLGRPLNQLLVPPALRFQVIDWAHIFRISRHIGTH